MVISREASQPATHEPATHESATHESATPFSPPLPLCIVAAAGWWLVGVGVDVTSMTNKNGRCCFIHQQRYSGWWASPCLIAASHDHQGTIGASLDYQGLVVCVAWLIDMCRYLCVCHSRHIHMECAYRWMIVHIICDAPYQGATGDKGHTHKMCHMSHQVSHQVCLDPITCHMRRVCMVCTWSFDE